MAEADATMALHPMWINLEPAMEELQGYPQAELDLKVFACIAGYANSQGVAFPLQATIADKIGETKMNVNRSVHRLVDKCFLKVLRQEKKYNDIHPRNVYGIASDMVRETPDTRSSHFDAEKWRVVAARLKKHVVDAVEKVKQVASSAAENMSARKRKPRAHRTWKEWQQDKEKAEIKRRDEAARFSQQTDHDLEETPLMKTPSGLWMAKRWMMKHRQEKEYSQLLQEAVQRFQDYAGPYWQDPDTPPDTPYQESSAASVPESSLLEQRVIRSLFQAGVGPGHPGFLKAGHWMLDCLSDEPTEEEYTRVFREALDRFGLPNTSHVSQPSTVLRMSSEDEPKTLGSMLGGVLA